MLRDLWSWMQTHEDALWIVTGVTAGLLVMALISLPVALALMPEDALLERERAPGGHPILRAVLTVLRNVLGWIVLLAGVAMLALPGQGLLTILVGLLLVDVPGKHRLVVRVMRRPKVRDAVAWIRRRAGRPPLKLPDDGPTS